ncbi:hypothetical protein FQN60_012702 [Etheostoma spectabile]|uniref:Uncharacterized protein n=1 Tax=Etheostoma spectabile TaxID=54343 RepID=A0A5J5D5I7_9PERO|nr:hypothetical protein FQN60_012702 [Etheostoma spectabile]
MEQLGRGCLASRQSWPSRWSTTSATERRDPNETG